ncbi:MAG TPA: Zn-ribbon domain-containing OB-fold protein [Pseudomonadales bacterium]|nr:Zn-ribbon domain-containing OB-fold protein [Pseudomonadales bacterium]
MSEQKPVEIIDSPVYMQYSFAAGRATSNFLRSIKEGKLVGQRSSVTGKVIVPPRGADPETGTPTTEEVTLPETATVISFTVVYIPIPNSKVQPPFIVANMVLDNSDQTFIHLVSGCDNKDVKIGTRVKAVWRDKSEWDYTFNNIEYFQPIAGEAPFNIDELKAKRLKEVEAFKHA